jgi:hypothetical protein
MHKLCQFACGRVLLLARGRLLKTTLYYSRSQKCIARTTILLYIRAAARDVKKGQQPDIPYPEWCSHFYLFQKLYIEGEHFRPVWKKKRMLLLLIEAWL